MQQNTFFSLKEVIDRQPITVSVETPLNKASALMHQHGNSCNVVGEEVNTTLRNNSSCVLVVEEKRLRGIFTERNLVKLVARGTDTQNVTVGEMMTKNVITLVFADDKDIFSALTLLNKHRIRHLPVVDEMQNLLGLITAKSIRQKLQPINLMKWRKVSEIMESRVIYAAPDASIQNIASLMANNKISCVAIVETQLDRESDRTLVQPIGIITERDIIQFHNLNLDLELPARDYMSAPLFLVAPEDSLWDIYQQMKQRRVRRLLVAGNKGELAGIITQSSLLQVFDPTEIHSVVEALQRQVSQLERSREALLQERNSKLEQEVQERTTDLELTNKQLIEAHQQLFFHVNNSPLAVVEWDSDFCVKSWSEQAEQMFGWQESEVLGKSWSKWHFVLEADFASVTEITERLLNGTESRNISHNRNYTKDGSVIDCEWYNSVLLDDAGNLVSVLSLTQNVSERETARRERLKTADELQARIRQQQAVAELGQLALQTDNLDPILDLAVNLVATTLEVEYCKVLSLLPDGNSLLLRAGVGWQDGLVGNARVENNISSQAGYTLISSEPVIVENLATETRFSGPSLLIEHQVVSGMSIIIHDGEQSFGIFGVHTTQHRVFSQDDINFVRAIANIIAQTSERIIVKNELQQQFQLEQLIASTSSRLLAASGERLTTEIESVLQTIGEFTQVDTCYIFRLSEDRTTFSMSHEWMVTGSEPQIENTQNFPVSMFPWAIALIERNEVVKIPDVADLPTEARIYRESWQTFNIHSLVCIPFIYQNQIEGWIGFASCSQTVDWSDNQIDLLKIIGETISSALERQQVNLALTASEQKFDSILSSLNDIVWSVDARTFKLIYINQAAENIYGYPVAEFYQNDALWLKAVHPEDRDRVSQFPHIAIERGSCEMEYRIVRPDGQIRWLLDRANLTYDADGKPLRIDGNSTDITQRKQAEVLLKESQDRYTLAVEGSSSGLWDWNILTNKVFYAPRWKEILACADADLPNTVEAWSTKLHPDDRDRVMAALQNHLEQRTLYNIEYRLQKKNGDYCWVQARAQAIWNKSGQPIRMAGSIDDISDRKRRESILKDIASGVSIEVGEKFFITLTKYLSKTLQVDYAFISKLSQSKKGQVNTLAVYGEGAAIANFAYDLANAPCGNVIERGLCVYPEAVQELFPDIPPLQTMEAESYAGMPIFDGAGRVLGLIAIVDSKPLEDIALIEEVLKIFASRTTAELERQQAVSKIEEQAALLDVATDAIMVRGLDDKILFWNKGAEKLYGWTKAEALNKTTHQLFSRTSPTESSKTQQIVLEQGKWQGELKKVTKTNQEIVVLCRWTLVKDNIGQPQAYLVVTTDITEQKQLETQFLRTQRLESLGTLAGGIAHDLNNILAPILGFSKLLPLKLPNVDEQTKGFFKIMETNANRGTALVKQILTFSRGLEGEKGIVQIRHLISEIAQIINETFPKSIQLETSVPKTLWTVNADVNQLHQVLMNLSVNARDAMTDGGTLTINAENTTVDAEYARLHLDATEGDYVLISVDDTGAGISPEIIDRIFEPFFTTKEVGRGTGLGLSTVIGIVRSHGGFVEVNSDRKGSNQGTQFKVFLPASDISQRNTKEVEEDLNGNDELILVVDDESAILEVTKATLETYNYQVLTASDGMEAIATYAQNRENIKAVIMDIMMPSMDGKTAIRTLKQINPELKIIAVSGLIERQEIIAELDGDITAFMNKPYANEDILKTIRELLNP